MTRRKKIDLNTLADNFMAEIETRFAQMLKQELGGIQQRLEQIERDLAERENLESGERPHKICKKSGCRGHVVAHGLCSRHYQQWRYHKKKSERQVAQDRDSADLQGSAANGNVPGQGKLKSNAKTKTTTKKSALQAGSKAGSR